MNFNVEAINMPEVTYDISPINIDPKRYEHLKDDQFTEKLPMTPKTPKWVELLVGEPYLHISTSRENHRWRNTR